MLPSVSVIIRAYNAEKYIGDAILSVINQTYEGPIELIVLFDEGSRSKATLEIVKTLENKYANQNRIFRVVSHQHTTPFRSLLIGLLEARGDFIAFLDYDNVYDKEFISIIINEMQKHNLDVAFGAQIFVDNTLKPIGKLSPPSRPDLIDLLHYNPMDISSIVISRRAKELLIDRLKKLDHRFFDWIFEDYLMALVFTYEKLNPVYIKHAQYLYRVHDSNLTLPKYLNYITNSMNRIRDIQTWIAFYHIYKDKLKKQEEIYLYVAIFRKMMALLIYGFNNTIRKIPIIIFTFILTDFILRIRRLKRRLRMRQEELL